jgi:hypothetical protein
MSNDALLENVWMAPALERICNEHVTTFAFNGLWDALYDFGCGAFEADEYVRWFWRTAPTWKPKNSQAEFNTFARERLSDKVGYTRRRNKAWGVIDNLFYEAEEKGITFEQILDALRFLCPTEPMPFPTEERGGVTFIDVTQREDAPKILKVDTDFARLVVELYPWRREGNQLLKTIPIGSTSREFDLKQLAFWNLYRDAEKPEREHAIDFHDGDPLNWLRTNLFSNWREGWRAESKRNRFWKDPTEKGSGIISFNPSILDTVRMTRRKG